MFARIARAREFATGLGAPVEPWMLWDGWGLFVGCDHCFDAGPGAGCWGADGCHGYDRGCGCSDCVESDLHAIADAGAAA